MDEFHTTTTGPGASASKTVLRVTGCVVMLVVGSVWMLAGAAFFFYFGLQAGLTISMPGLAGLTASGIFATAKNGKLLILGGVLATLALGCTLYAAHMLRLLS